MTTLFLGSYGFGNLGDELCLIEAAARFPSDDMWAFSHDPEFTASNTPLRKFISERPQIQDIKPTRVVLGGGGVGFWPSLRDSLHWMYDAKLLGAELHIHNIGVSNIRQPEWREDPVVREVIADLASFTVRDHVSRWLVNDWGFGNTPKLSLYPEVDLPAEPFDLAPVDGRIVGVSLTSQTLVRAEVKRNRDRLRAILDEGGDFSVVPIISTVHAEDNEEDDVAAFEHFARYVLEGRTIVYPEMLDRRWWREHMTPLRLKHLISKLDLLVSQRKHNVIHAIGTGTRFLGVFPKDDDSIVRIIYSLRHRLPDGSGVVSLG